MPLTLLQPFNLNTTANYTFGNANITGVSNLGPVGNVVITGGSNGQVLSTNGSGNLSWISVSSTSISNGNSNVNIPAANGNINLSAAGNSNIVVVTGTGANIAGTLQVSGQSNLGAVGNVVITGGTANYVLSTDGSGNLSWVAQSGGGSSTINPSATGNAFIVFSNTTSGTFNAVANAGISANIANGAIIASAFVGSLANGNSDVSIPSANGNIVFDVAGNANIASVNGTGISVGSGSLTRAANVNANVPLYVVSNIDATAAGIVVHNRIATGYSSMDFHSSGNLYMGSVGGANPSAPLVALANTTYLYAAANTSGVVILAANTSGAVRIGGANTANVLVVTGTGANITGTGNFTGNLSAANASLGNLVTANFFSGVLTTAAQPNITSLGTLGSLNTTGNVSVGGNLSVTAKSNLGPNSNVIITGGASGAYLQTDGSGNLAWAAITGGAYIANGNSNIDISTANGNITMGVGGNANVVTVTTTGLLVSNITTGAGTGGNITGANVISANTLIISNSFSALGFTTSGNGNVNSNVSTVTSGAGFRALSNVFTDNVAAASSTIANAAIHAIGTPTLAAGNSSVTATNAATFYIQNAPTAGSNVTITNSYALFVASGATFLGGNLQITGALSVTGNLTLGNFNGVFANGNSDISIPAANGNIVFDVAGTSNVLTVTSTGISNTRINLRVANNGATTSGNITPNASLVDQFNFIGLTGAVNIAVPSGTYIDGQKLVYRFKDDGNARSLNWTGIVANSYRAIGVNLPGSTVANKVLYVGCVYNSQDSFWDVISVGQET